jgi:O-antigen ligase
MVFVVAGVFVVGAATPHASRLHSLIELISGTTVQESSAAERRDMVVEAWDLWREKPLWGWGFDQYRNVSSRGDYSHSNITELLVNGGVAAVALYYIAFWFVAMDIRRQWLRTRLRQNRLDLAWAALIAVVLCIWSVASVQYEQKLDAIVLSVASMVPAILKRGPALEESELLVSRPRWQESRTYERAR